MNKKFLILITAIIFSDTLSYAGNFGVGAHTGYGILKYEEKTSALGTNVESESRQNVILFGISGEYSLSKPENFFAGITTDWAFGLKGRETWREDDSEIQTNDMEVFGQFYDLRFGYKNTLKNFYYKIYASGGWDGLHFKRDRFVWRGVSSEDSVKEDFSLWRTGIGAGAGYKLNQWAIDGRAAYSYYPKGEVKNSSLPQFTFDTEGTCLDMGIGISREIEKNLKFYIGGSYTLLKLSQSNIMSDGSVRAVLPSSKTEIIIGVVNLTYAFSAILGEWCWKSELKQRSQFFPIS